MQYQTYADSGVRLSRTRDSRGYYRIRWTAPADGSPQDARRQHRGEAEAFAQEMHGLLLAAVQGATGIVDTVDALADQYLDPARRDRPWAVNTAIKVEQILRVHVRPFIGDKRCYDWTSQDSRDILGHAREAGKADTTVSAIGRQLRGLATYGLAAGFLVRDPMKGVRYTGRGSTVHGQARSYVDPDDVPREQHVKALAGQMPGPYGKGRVYVAAYAGLRAAELHGLHAEDLDLDRRVIRVRRQAYIHPVERRQMVEPPKGGKERHTIFPGFVAELLRPRVEELGGYGILFPDHKGTYVDHGSFHRPERAARKRAGWPADHKGKQRWSWHDLRHFFCTWMIHDMGMRPADVSKWAGHFSVGFTLESYVGDPHDDVERALAAL